MYPIFSYKIIHHKWCEFKPKNWATHFVFPDRSRFQDNALNPQFFSLLTEICCASIIFSLPQPVKSFLESTYRSQRWTTWPVHLRWSLLPPPWHHIQVSSVLCRGRERLSCTDLGHTANRSLPWVQYSLALITSERSRTGPDKPITNANTTVENEKDYPLLCPCRMSAAKKERSDWSTDTWLSVRVVFCHLIFGWEISVAENPWQIAYHQMVRFYYSQQ